ncbi:ras guanine nucleotide exchange factor P-like [Aphis gossypii]|uniref:ras guanine nucleotide exchange factor P-like n=1 Tax=Aphis gossypii TaxID=80765 RepID=UPI0021590A3A|nr:ras guanine nucleotide exchange factor P-like [Aphis gossypii]
MAVPFRPPSHNSDTARDHYLRIENLLRELLTLLSRMPSWMSGDLSSYSNNGINISPQTVPPAQSLEERDRLWVQQQQHSIRMFHRRRLRERQQQERREQQQVVEEEQESQQHAEQQQVLLPDLVTSCGPTVRQQPPPPPPPPSSQQRPEQHQSAVDDDKFVDAVKLQVAVCPTCYYGKERKLKVIGVAKLDGNGKPIRWSTHREDEELLVIEDKSTKVKRRIMSLLQPSKIESSVLTAMFVIIGWKMFIKQ